MQETTGIEAEANEKIKNASTTNRQDQHERGFWRQTRQKCYLNEEERLWYYESNKTQAKQTINIDIE